MNFVTKSVTTYQQSLFIFSNHILNTVFLPLYIVGGIYMGLIVTKQWLSARLYY